MASPNPQVNDAVTAVARESRRSGPKSPRLPDLRRDLAAAKLADYIKRTLEAAPDLTAAQRDRLALLLRGGDAQ